MVEINLFWSIWVGRDGFVLFSERVWKASAGVFFVYVMPCSCGGIAAGHHTMVCCSRLGVSTVQKPEHAVVLIMIITTSQCNGFFFAFPCFCKNISIT